MAKSPSKDIKKVKLNDGNEIPLVGFGTWQSEPGKVGKAVEVAIDAGYPHLDFAKIYCNQKEIAPALKDINRKEYFITSKLWNSQHKPELVEKALDDTLQELGLDYLDLYLVHWPVPFENTTGDVAGSLNPVNKEGTECLIDSKTTLIETWKAVVALLKTGKVKSVGVSNFNIESIEAITNASGVTPAVLQVERHPYLLQRDLIDYCKKKGIHVTAYSGFGNNSEGQPLLIEHPIVKKIAEKHNAKPGQVLIAWSVYSDISIIPKSVTPSRIEENFHVVNLDAEDVKEIDSIGEKEVRRYNVAYNYKPRWDINVFDTPVEKKATYQINIGK